MNLNQKFKNLRFMFRFKAYGTSLGAMISGNRVSSVVGLVARLTPAMQGRLSKGVILNARVFFRRIFLLYKHQGFAGLVKYLKAASVYLQQAICGYKTGPSNPRVSRTAGGLPRIIPILVRKQIQKGNPFWIRFSLTFFSFFRSIEVEGVSKLSTITDDFSGNPQYLEFFTPYLGQFSQLILGTGKWRVDLDSVMRKGLHLFPIMTSSPQALALKDAKGDRVRFASSHPLSVIKSAHALSDTQVTHLRVLGNFVSGGNSFSNPVMDLLSRIRTKGTLGYVEPAGVAAPYKGSYTGKLSEKQEAAMKVRVFAMVDPFTQWTLYPLHEALFAILRPLGGSIDGTFDQLKPIKEALKRQTNVFFPMFSMDLSAATDRLPVLLQEKLISSVFNMPPAVAESWRELLVGRPYLLPDVGEYRYSVGQPMGAYSSWGMLALTHHFIVQVAAWSSGVVAQTTLFKDYVVLGDDIVIFNAKVAKAYHNLISMLGVECNLAKSIMSPKGLGLEFAKHTYFKGVDVSPTTFDELSSAVESVTGLIDYGKKYGLSLQQLLTVAGFGYKVKGSLNKPLAYQNLKVKFLVLTAGVLDPSLLQQTLTSMLKWGMDSDSFHLSIIKFVASYLSDLTVKARKVKTDLMSSGRVSGATFPKVISTVQKLHPKGWATFLAGQPEYWTAKDQPDFLGKVESKLRPVYERVHTAYTLKYVESVNSFLYLVERKLSIFKTSTEALSNLIQALKAYEDVSAFSASALLAKGELNSFRVSAPKLFRMGQEWLRVLQSLKEAGILAPTTLKGEGFIMLNYLAPKEGTSTSPIYH